MNACLVSSAFIRGQPWDHVWEESTYRGLSFLIYISIQQHNNTTTTRPLISRERSRRFVCPWY